MTKPPKQETDADPQDPAVPSSPVESGPERVGPKAPTFDDLFANLFKVRYPLAPDPEE